MKRLKAKGVDPNWLALVGASNGTTTALDYLARGDASTTVTAFVLLTGGRYTEKQTELAARVTGQTRLLFVYDDKERAWSTAKKKGAPPLWSFREAKGAGHGTKMFGPEPALKGEVVRFITKALALSK